MPPYVLVEGEARRRQPRGSVGDDLKATARRLDRRRRDRKGKRRDLTRSHAVFDHLGGAVRRGPGGMFPGGAAVARPGGTAAGPVVRCPCGGGRGSHPPHHRRTSPLSASASGA